MKSGFIRSYGSSKYGMGHFFRSLELADRLFGTGASAGFLLKPEEKMELLPFFKGRPFEIHTIEGENFNRADFLLYDMPFTDPALIGSFRRSNPASRITALDYSDSSETNIDTVVNLFDHSRMLDGRSRNQKTRFLCGTQYAIIRGKFFPLRNPQRKIPEKARNILITFGGADPAENTLQLLEHPEIFRDMAVTVIVGVNFRSRDRLYSKSGSLPPNIQLMDAVADIEKLMSSSDLVICGSGTTVLEAMFLGIPALAIPQTQDEKAFGKHIQDKGGCVLAEFAENGVAKALEKLQNCEIRRLLSENSMRLVDGKGAERIIETLL